MLSEPEDRAIMTRQSATRRQGCVVSSFCVLVPTRLQDTDHKLFGEIEDNGSKQGLSTGRLAP